MIKTILWDIDGTLLDFKYSERNALLLTFREFGFELSENDVSVYSEINDTYWTKFDRGEITKQDIYTLRLAEFFDHLRAPAEKRPTVAQVNTRYQTALGETFRFMPHALETVTEFKGQMRQYIVTNGSVAAQKGKITLSGLGKIMDGVFISELMGLKKPDIEYFERCFEEIPDCKPSETVIIGDSLTSDMQGGVNAGIHTIWYNPVGKENENGLPIEYEIRDLAEVPEIINKINLL